MHYVDPKGAKTVLKRGRCSALDRQQNLEYLINMFLAYIPDMEQRLNVRLFSAHC